MYVAMLNEATVIVDITGARKKYVAMWAREYVSVGMYTYLHGVYTTAHQFHEDPSHHANTVAMHNDTTQSKA